MGSQGPSLAQSVVKDGVVIPLGPITEYQRPFFAGHNPEDFTSIKHFCDFLKGKAKKSVPKKEDKKEKKGSKKWKDDDEEDEEMEDEELIEDDDEMIEEDDGDQEDSGSDIPEIEDDESDDDKKKSQHVNWLLKDKKSKEPEFWENIVHFLPKWIEAKNLNYWLWQPEYVVYNENQVRIKYIIQIKNR